MYFSHISIISFNFLLLLLYNLYKTFYILFLVNYNKMGFFQVIKYMKNSNYAKLLD